MSIILVTSDAVSRPDARPVTCSVVPLEEVVTLELVLELLETDEVDISTLVIGPRGERPYGVYTPSEDYGPSRPRSGSRKCGLSRRRAPSADPVLPHGGAPPPSTPPTAR